MTIVADDNAATSGGGHAEGAMERALAAAVRDAGRIGDLLDELSRGRLWLPLPDDGRPVTDGVFPETKEFLAGYWIIEVDRPERAYEVAGKASAAPGPGGKPLNMDIEVREVMSVSPVES